MFNTQIHDHWLGTSISITRGGVTIVLWAQAVSEMMESCK